MRSRDRAPAVGIAVSALLHVGMVVAVAMSPDPPAPPKPERSEPVEVELISIEVPAEPAPQPEIRPIEAPESDPSEPEPSEAEPEAELEPQPVPERPQTSPAPSPAPSDESVPGGDLGEVEDGVALPNGAGSEGALSLGGLRGSSGTRPSSGVPVPRVSAATVPRKPLPQAPEGPALPPTDREPQSLGEAGFRKRKDGSYRLWKPGAVVTAKILPDGRMEFRDRVVSVSGTRAGVGGSVAQAMAGEEQFKIAKARLLRETLDLLMKLAQTWAREQMRKQLAQLGGQLRRTWGRTEWPQARRRKALFSMWDDCEEPVGGKGVDSKSVQSALDAARAEAGRRARSTILGFIRRELPKGSDAAYSAAELDALNASRRSRERFDPY